MKTLAHALARLARRLVAAAQARVPGGDFYARAAARAAWNAAVADARRRGVLARAEPPDAPAN